MTAETSQIADENGLERVTVSFARVGDYRVQSNEGRSFAFTVVPEYGTHWLAEGMTTTVRVYCADCAGNEECLTSVLTEDVRGLLVGTTLVDTSDQSAFMLLCRNVTIRGNWQSPMVKAICLSLCMVRDARP